MNYHKLVDMTGKPDRPPLSSLLNGICQRRPLYLIGLAVLATEGALSQTAPGSSQDRANKVASEFFEEPAWQAVCSRALAVVLPPAAATLAHSAAAEPAPAAEECDEQTLYYGFGKSPNSQAALQCAYRNRAHPDVPSNGPLEGAGTLAMLYANGDGVPRDYELAIRFACEVAIKALLSPQAQTMLADLQAAETAFEQARIKGEYPGGGGSGSEAFALGDQDRLREQFVINLEDFSTGKLPVASSAIRLRAQQELDAAYVAALAVPRNSNTPFGQPTLNGIGTTEAAWQQLFERWMLFVPPAFPALSPDAVATKLLRLRIHQIKKATY